VGVEAAARTGSGMHEESAARKVLLNEWICAMFWNRSWIVLRFRIG